MEEQTNEALWYVVHTYSGYENKVANDLQTMVENRHLQDLICDIKVPTEMVPEIKDGKERMVEHKLFPRLRSGQDGHERRYLVCGAQHARLHRFRRSRIQARSPLC